MPLSNLRRSILTSLILLWPFPAIADPDPGWWSYFTSPGYALGGAGRDAIVFDGHLIVAGSFEHCWNGQSIYDLRRIGRFNGNSWGQIADGFNDVVRALYVNDGELYAGGEFTQAGLTAVSYIARWDGWSWNPVGNPGRVTAVGSFGGTLVSGVYSTGGIKSWDGESWSTLGGGLDADIRSIAEFNGDLYVGGNINFAEGLPVTDIVRWDGASWSDFGTILTEGPFSWGMYPVEVLSTEYDGTLLVGGYFSHVNGIYANGFARWDGATWTGLGQDLGPAAAVSDITVYNGDLVVVGGFTLPDGGARIARWNGTSWSSFGIGISASPFDSDLTVQPFDGDLYVAGSFFEAGGKSSYNIARWRETGTWTPFLPESGQAGLWISGANPTSSGTSISFALLSAGHVDLSIFDLAGRRIATLLSEHRLPGISSVQWNGHDQGGNPASGVYFVALETDRERLVRKVVVQR